jgi:Kef-type K+ transport system membrane component KefB
VVLFLPSFFAFTGMRTQIGLVSGAHDWIACIAIHPGRDASGKFGGTFVAARMVGMGWRHSSRAGSPDDTRGLRSSSSSTPGSTWR